MPRGTLPEVLVLSCFIGVGELTINNSVAELEQLEESTTEAAAVGLPTPLGGGMVGDFVAVIIAHGVATYVRPIGCKELHITIEASDLDGTGERCGDKRRLTRERGRFSSVYLSVVGVVKRRPKIIAIAAVVLSLALVVTERGRPLVMMGAEIARPLHD